MDFPTRPTDRDFDEPETQTPLVTSGGPIAHGLCMRVCPAPNSTVCFFTRPTNSRTHFPGQFSNTPSTRIPPPRCPWVTRQIHACCPKTLAFDVGLEGAEGVLQKQAYHHAQPPPQLQPSPPPPPPPPPPPLPPPPSHPLLLKVLVVAAPSSSGGTQAPRWTGRRTCWAFEHPNEGLGNTRAPLACH